MLDTDILICYDEGYRQAGARGYAVERELLLYICLLYTSDAADERSSVDLGGRRIIKKKKIEQLRRRQISKSQNTTER